MGLSSPASALERFRFLFGEAEAAVPVDTKAILADHAAKGLIQSGGTLKRVARSAEAATSEAMPKALDAVGRASPRAGRRRSRLLDDLTAEFEAHWDRMRGIAWGGIANLGLDDKRAAFEELLDQSRVRLLAEIEQYRKRWTDPETRPWKERHPTQHDLLMAVFGGIIAIIAAAVVLPRLDVGNLIGL